jgi:hypothetical protein
MAPLQQSARSCSIVILGGASMLDVLLLALGLGLFGLIAAYALGCERV